MTFLETLLTVFYVLAALVIALVVVTPLALFILWLKEKSAVKKFLKKHNGERKNKSERRTDKRIGTGVDNSLQKEKSRERERVQVQPTNVNEFHEPTAF